MKKVTKIILSLLLVLIIGAAGVCWWQWDNIMAVKMSFSHSRDDISDMMTDNNQKIADASRKVEGVTVRDLTDEEKQALRDGLLDREELMDRLTAAEEPAPGQDTPQQPSQTDTKPDAPASSTVPSEQKPEDTNQKKLAAYLAEIYVMKEEYTAWLEAKYDEAIAEYVALDPAEKTAAAKYRIGMRCMKEALAKEKECDALMADIEAKIHDLLVEMGEDTSLVDDIKAAYAEEKELKKAYYLGLHS